MNHEIGWIRYRCWALCALLLALLSGCASTITQGGRVDPDSLVRAVELDDATAIEDAVRNAGLSPNQWVRAPGYNEGTPLLTVAAKTASIRVVRYLLSAGADIDAQTPIGESSVMLATFFGATEQRGRFSERHEQAVRVLVESGARLENHPGRYTPLAYAAFRGHDRLVEYFLARGAQVDGSVERGLSYTNTPLMMATMEGHESTVALLLKAGADPRVRVRGGYDASELARKHRHGNIFSLLQCRERVAARGVPMHGC